MAEIVFTPPESWLEAFEAQASTELYRRAARYARSRAQMVWLARGYTDDLYVKELVQDAFSDTLIGELLWDPQRCTLEAHIINAIRGRSRHHREHALRFPTESVDAASLGASPPSRDPIESMVRDVVIELRALAHDDEQTLALLDAFGEGNFVRKDIVRQLRWTEKTYRNARVRLARYVKQLPAGLASRSRSMRAP